MKKLVEDRFDDIEAAITNGETDVLLNDRQNGNRKRQKHTRFEKGEKPKESEKSDDEGLEKLKEIGESEEYTGIPRSDRRGNGKKLDFEEILGNDESNDEDDNDDVDTEVRNTRKSFSCQQTVIKTITTTIPL